jgi:hypothetical protein
MRRPILIVMLSGLAMTAVMAGCNDAQTGALLGAGGGAGLGAIIGHNTSGQRTAEGAAIGAGAGALIGYIVGNESDKAKQQQQQRSYYDDRNY